MSFGTVWTRTHDPEIKMAGPQTSRPRSYSICTPLIQSPILYSAKEHVQKRSFGKFKTSWCTKIKHLL